MGTVSPRYVISAVGLGFPPRLPVAGFAANFARLRLVPELTGARGRCWKWQFGVPCGHTLIAFVQAATAEISR